MNESKMFAISNATAHVVDRGRAGVEIDFCGCGVSVLLSPHDWTLLNEWYDIVPIPSLGMPNPSPIHE